jgi:energy-coupling factor transporter ATP-binding protein EcfA2
MGLCASNNNAGPALTPAEQKRRKDESNQSKLVDQQMEKDNATQSTFNKLLLLGAGESGKSTLFKQMISIYGRIFILFITN